MGEVWLRRTAWFPVVVGLRVLANVVVTVGGMDVITILKVKYDNPESQSQSKSGFVLGSKSRARIGPLLQSRSGAKFARSWSRSLSRLEFGLGSVAKSGSRSGKGLWAWSGLGRGGRKK